MSLRPSALAAAALVLVAGLLGGCSHAVTRPAASADPLAVAKAAPLTQMTPADKRSKIATSFPMQVPVPAGDVLRGEAQGPSAWDYQLVVTGDVTSVERWYFDVYRGSEWALVSHSTTMLALQKNRAQTQLKFEAVSGSTPKTRITGAVGVGTPVLQTQ